MRVSYGNGGWVRVDGVGLPGPVYVRFAADERGRWRAVEIYIDGHDTPLSTAMLRQLRLDLLEAAVLQDDNMAARSQTPGPDLHRLAAHYATTWGKTAYHGQHCDTCGGPIKGVRGRILALRNWVAESWFAQLPDSGIRHVPMPREPRALDAELEELPAIEQPAEHRMTDDFLHTVARAYALAALKGLAPLPAIAAGRRLAPGGAQVGLHGAKARDHAPRHARTSRVVTRWQPPKVMRRSRDEHALGDEAPVGDVELTRCRGRVRAGLRRGATNRLKASVERLAVSLLCSCEADNLRGMRTIAVRLRPGADLKGELLALAAREGVRAGWVLTCVGSLSRVRLRLAGGAKHETWQGAFEIVALTGTLSGDGGHLHLAAADHQGRTFGGHLAQGCVVRTTAEVVLAADDRLVFGRQHDPATGYDELVVRERDP